MPSAAASSDGYTTLAAALRRYLHDLIDIDDFLAVESVIIGSPALNAFWMAIRGGRTLVAPYSQG
jgi:hypothetical protein